MTGAQITADARILRAFGGLLGATRATVDRLQELSPGPETDLVSQKLYDLHEMYDQLVRRLNDEKPN